MKTKFVIVSKDENFQMIAVDFRRIAEENIGMPVFEANNSRPLAEVYNSYLADFGEYDNIVFLHSDVKFDVYSFVKKLENLAGKYDLVGLCGCSKIQVSQSPLNWFCGSRPYPEARWGCVTHGELGNQTSFFSSHHPDVLDHEVACIDGLCIAISKKAASAGLRFDENLGRYDFYDTDISFQAIMKYGLKVGVIVQKDLVHYSVGKSILEDDFLKTELKFRSKWNFEIPKGSRLEQIAGQISQKP